METTTEDLQCIIYVSKSVALDDEILTKILATSRAWNFEHNITGILLYNDGNLMQVLEGPGNEIKPIFEKIKMDKRHKEVSLIVSKDVKCRSFSKWSMAFRTVDKNLFNQIQIEAYNDPLNTRLLPDNPNADNSILSLINLFTAIIPNN